MLQNTGAGFVQGQAVVSYVEMGRKSSRLRIAGVPLVWLPADVHCVDV